MTEKSTGIPQNTATTGTSLGRTVTGPAKRNIDNTVYAANKHATTCKRFLTNLNSSNITPSTDQLKKLDSMLMETHKQVANLKALPTYVAGKKAHQLVSESANKEKFHKELDDYLNISQYLTSIATGEELIKQLENVLSEHGQTCSQFDESIHDANSAVECMEQLIIDPTTGELVEFDPEHPTDGEGAIEQLTRELEMKEKLLEKHMEDAREYEKDYVEHPTPLARTEIEQQHKPNEETVDLLADSNSEGKLIDSETDTEKVELERQAKAAEEQRLRDKIAAVDGQLANRGVAAPTPNVSINENQSIETTPHSTTHTHPTIPETNISSQPSQNNNNREKSTHPDVSLASDQTQLLILQHIERLERQRERDQKYHNDQVASLASSVERMFTVMHNANQRAKDTRQHDGEIMPSEDEDEYARRYMEMGDSQNDDSHTNHRIPHSTPRPKTVPAHLKNVTFDNIKSNLITFNGTASFYLFRTTFYDYVINNPHFSKEHKLVLLESQLKGPALQCLYHLEDPEESVRLTFKELEKKYGQKCDKMTLHYRIARLPFHATDFNRMADDLRAHRKLLSEMKERGMNVDDEMIIKSFCTKLPRHIKAKLVPLVSAHKDNLTFEMVHDAVEDEIDQLQIRETFFEEVEPEQRRANEIPAAIHAADAHQSHPTGNFYRNNNTQQFNRNTQHGGHQGGSAHRGYSRQPTNGSYQNNYSQSNNNSRNPEPRPSPNNFTDTSGETLEEYYKPGYSGPNLSIIRYSFPFDKPEKQSQCNVCNMPHHPIRCPLPSTEFRKMLKTKGLCELCTGKSHNIETCNSRFMCGYCRGCHHMGACPQKEFYRNLANFPSGAGPIVREETQRKKFFRVNPRTTSQ